MIIADLRPLSLYDISVKYVPKRESQLKPFNSDPVEVWLKVDSLSSIFFSGSDLAVEGDRWKVGRRSSRDAEIFLGQAQTFPGTKMFWDKLKLNDPGVTLDEITCNKFESLLGNLSLSGILFQFISLAFVNW